MSKKQINEYKDSKNKKTNIPTKDEFLEYIRNLDEYQEYKDLTPKEFRKKCTKEVLEKFHSKVK